MSATASRRAGAPVTIIPGLPQADSRRRQPVGQRCPPGPRKARPKVLRQSLSMTLAEFAEAFHLPITTLRDWEQHCSTPDALARALLLAIERDPEIMRRLLADKAA